MLLAFLASIGMVAYFINYSTEQTKKVSFKAARLEYRKHYTVEVIMSPPVMPTKEKQLNTKSLSSAKPEGKNQTIVTKINSVNKPEQAENTEIIRDLQVLSSFDCVKSIPTVLLDYLSNMFLSEYGRSHQDFHSAHKVDERLPLLKSFSINCDMDQNCSTSFQYDKQYGVSTTADKTYSRKDVFYCCPSIHSLTNQTISDTCERAQKVVGKSGFRESKNSALLEKVNKIRKTIFTS